ncbi:hypothetical protein ACFZCY_05715 [Streptomyces sp. NPDC007983]|uniref:hypothetical protein n=1 Tax=Streptomyces sp. NPDC007983 TaxID=3364800 RepID=UPI0036EB1E72
MDAAEGDSRRNTRTQDDRSQYSLHLTASLDETFAVSGAACPGVERGRGTDTITSAKWPVAERSAFDNHSTQDH